MTNTGPAPSRAGFFANTDPAKHGLALYLMAIPHAAV